MTPDEADIANALARVCTDEPNIRARLEQTGEVAILDRLIEAVRGNGNQRECLDELHGAIQRSGDALGVYAPMRNPGVRPVGMGAPRPIEVVFLCPRSECSRTWRPDPNPQTTVPECRLHREPLHWKQL